ncbi:MAG: TraR/DksA C4-type zinc finger protein [Candidatus Paceibacterota bacterium]|jgi:RNA polymerase-binding transcription factor DksA
MNIDTKRYKLQLEKEFKLVEGELRAIGRKNPSNPADWEAVETEIDSDHADVNDVADNIESYEENRAVLSKLENQYNDIKDALKRVADGTYGKCSVCGEEIPEARLEANPSAKNCIKHTK